MVVLRERVAMQKRKRLGVLIAGTVALVCVAAFMLWPRPMRVTAENYNRIKAGMTRAEVETILGGPPGDYATEATAFADRAYEYQIDLPRGEVVRASDWRADTIIIRVAWDGDVVKGTVCEPNKSSGASWLENLHWRVKRQWRRWFPDK
jgi:hypothetical protein